MRTAFFALLAPLTLAACNWGDSCFIAGTQVLTPDGPKPIETLRVGDSVYSYSHEESARVVRKVQATLRDRAREVRAIRVGGRVIRGVTAEHPFFDLDQARYRPARELRAGDALARLEGGELVAAEIESIAATELPSPTIDVFNLTVEGPEHNYFVEGILVHNKEPVERRCEDDLVQIAPHRELDGGAGAAGDYDVTVPKADASTGEIRIYVYRENGDAAPATQERIADGLYRVRLQTLEPGNYEIHVAGSAGSYTSSFCRVQESYPFTLGEAADAGADDAISPDAGASDADTDDAAGGD